MLWRAPELAAAINRTTPTRARARSQANKRLPMQVVLSEEPRGVSAAPVRLELDVHRPNRSPAIVAVFWHLTPGTVRYAHATVSTRRRCRDRLIASNCSRH